MIREFRLLVGVAVRLERKNGLTIEGVLHSLIPKSAWIVTDEGDQFVPLDEIVVLERV